MMLSWSIELPDLSGSPKKVIQAEDIRAKALNNIFDMTHAIYMACSQQVSATWWIDHEGLIDNQIKKAKLR